MLSVFIEKNLVSYEKKFDNWEDAVRHSCKQLINTGRITKEYEDSIVESINTFGPYIVITEGIAIPHSTQGGEGVLDSAISFMKVDEPVEFPDGEEIKRAQLFFTLAALDSTQHLQNMKQLMELLMNEEIIEKLKLTHSVEELKALAEEYNL